MHYHFQLHWLVCTPRLIEDLLLNWSRVAEKNGFKIVEAPVEQAASLSNDNPFQAATPIPLAVAPPNDGSKDAADLVLSEQWYEMELLKRQGYVLDVEADSLFPQGGITCSFERAKYKYTQMIHRSGVAFVQILEPGRGYLGKIEENLH
ncbi:vacuolar membrane-associated protein iml1 [Phlyctochytrium bullatum]|nr:vacuolar membrane-associated protein iml1 [Phlyctochytrium bullatum]